MNYFIFLYYYIINFIFLHNIIEYNPISISLLKIKVDNEAYSSDENVSNTSKENKHKNFNLNNLKNSNPMPNFNYLMQAFNDNGFENNQKILSELSSNCPWSSMTSLLLYRPIRRSLLIYDENHCDKLIKASSRIIFYIIQLICKLRTLLIKYVKKECSKKKSKVTSFIIGCKFLKKKILKNIALYKKYKHDYLDAIVGITQCSLSKNEYLSKTVPVIYATYGNEEVSECSLLEYYLIYDYLLFVSYIKKVYELLIVKLEETLNKANSCTNCFKKSNNHLCYSNFYEKIFIDSINMELFLSNLNDRIYRCKNYLILNHLFSTDIPEEVEYLTLDGDLNQVPDIAGIRNVKFVESSGLDSNEDVSDNYDFINLIDDIQHNNKDQSNNLKNYNLENEWL